MLCAEAVNIIKRRMRYRANPKNMPADIPDKIFLQFKQVTARQHLIIHNKRHFQQFLAILLPSTTIHPEVYPFFIEIQRRIDGKCRCFRANIEVKLIPGQHKAYLAINGHYITFQQVTLQEVIQ